MGGRNYCLASAVVFTLVALVHLWRAVLDLQLQIGAWSVPRSASVLGAVVSGLFAVWAFRSARGPKPTEVVYTS